MKSLFLFLLVICSFSGNAQTWKTLSDDAYISFPLSNSLSFLDFHYERSFRINPYDSSIWMANREAITRFDKDGNFTIFDGNDHPNFDNFSQIYDIAFTPDYVFAGSTVYGIFRYDGVSWQLVSGVNKCMQLVADEDTVFMAREGQPFLTLSPIGSSFGTTNFQKIASKNGELWGGTTNFLIHYVNNSSVYINPDTVDYLLSGTQFSIGFSPNTNDFYATSEKGISVALNRIFYDTITPYNTVGMPIAPVKEIAFDSQDNIWAVFGDPTTTLQHPISIGYLDRATATWTIYDSTNAPLNQQFWTIEVDPCDNLWVGEKRRFHVLLSGNCAQYDWLATTELDNIPVTIFPNPSNGTFTIETTESIKEVRVLELSGREISRSSFTKEIEVHATGTYIVELAFENGERVHKKISVY